LLHFKSFTCLVAGFHKSIKLNPKSNPEELYDIITNGKCLESFMYPDRISKDAERHLQKNKNEVLKFIEKNR
jgi:hypothetical protein